MVELSLKIPHSMGKLRGTLYRWNCVTSEDVNENGELALQVRMSSVDWQRLHKAYGNQLDDLVIPE
jgi:GTP-binding protein HflX